LTATGLCRYFKEHHFIDGYRANWLPVQFSNGVYKLNHFFGVKKQRKYDLFKLYEWIRGAPSGRHYLFG